MVANPYTLFSRIPPDTLYFTLLDLKDAFFTIPLHHSSQPLFAFTWTDTDTYPSQQLIWTVLPQGFRDSPHFFGEDLQRDWQTLDLGSTTLLQYGDDFLLCSSSHHHCLVHTAKVLNALGNWGYRASLSKAQIASNIVNYMRLLLTPTPKIIPAQTLQALTQTPRPKPRELLPLLGLLNFFQICVPTFALHTKSLYQATWENLDEPYWPPLLSTP